MSAVTLPPAAADRKRRLRLDFLDGLRGLAALYVVVHHAYFEVAPHWDGGGLSPRAQSLTHWLLYGHFAVGVFIVLSGYCLMLPVARDASGRLKGGAGDYLRRRARRILPPYYAALALSLLLIALVPGLQQKHGVRWDIALPAFAPGPLLSHLLLLHNLSQDWASAIDPPLWSVGAEWQIYFFLPFVLLPVWRRWGLPVTVALAFALGFAPHVLLPARHNLDWTFPWYLGLFALGMAAATAAHAPGRVGAFWSERMPWGVCAALLGVVTVFLSARSMWWLSNLWVMDTLVGATTACLLLWCARHALSDGEEARPLVLRLLESPACVTLGAFSYSLYLVHFPVLSALHLALRPLHLSPRGNLALLLGAGTPLCVGLAYGFHLLFERRFMSHVPAPHPAHVAAE